MSEDLNIPAGVSSEELLRAVLPIAVKAAADSARAATEAGKAISSFERELSDGNTEISGALVALKGSVDTMGTRLKGVESQLKKIHTNSSTLVKDELEGRKWARSLITPQLVTIIIFNVIAILTAAVGVRAVMPTQTAISMEQSTPPAIEEEAP